jgi:hypothetical protein
MRGSAALPLKGVVAAACLSIVLLGVGAGTALAGVRFAAPGGTGAQPCLETAPCDSEKALTGTGVNGVADGDSIILLPGTYHPKESLNVTHVVTISGQPGSPEPLIDGAGNYGLEVHDTTSVDDLRIDQASGIVGLFMLGSGTAERVYVTSEANNEQACSFYGAVVRDSFCGDSETGGAGIGLNSGGPETVPVALHNVTAVGALGIRVETFDEADVTVSGNNVIVAGTTRDLEAKTDSAAGTSAAIELNHSNFSTAATSGKNALVSPTDAEGNQSAKPLFVNAAAGDFSEAAGSPTLDAGIESADNGATDLAGNPRNVGGVPACAEPAPGPPDIGAYEFVPAALPASSCVVAIQPPIAPPAAAPSATCTVPKLKGKTLKSAKKRIRAAACLVGKPTKKRGATAKSAKVVKQVPKPGATVPVGTKVKVTLAP